MVRFPLLISLAVLCISLNAQITLIGHAMINNSPLTQVGIVVNEGTTILKSFNTQAKSDFKIVLDFGKVYRIYFSHPKSPVMFMEVIGNNIPAEKKSYLMTYELNVPFVYKIDEDVDTTVFTSAFHRVVFDGNRLMVEDTSYNNAFAKNIIRKAHRYEKGNTGKNLETSRTLTGRVCFNNDKNEHIRDKAIELLDKSGNTVKTASTNHFGQFCFTGINPSEISRIRIVTKCHGSCTVASLYSNDWANLGNSPVVNGNSEWTLQQTELMKLNDDYFTSNIGGKLVSSSSKEKKFFAKKDVYLCNKYNTVIQKIQTNLIGAFVFQDIKPDNTYHLCINKSDLVPGEKLDLLTKEDVFITSFDTIVAGKQALRIFSNSNKRFNELSVDNDEIKMDVKATIFGDNVNNPIGKLKILLLNDDYEVIDSAITDNFGTFKFKYLPFLKRFYLSAENTDNILDVFKNILIYSSDDNLIKIMTHQKGNKFSYSPLNTEISSLRDIELEDPWLELIDEKKPALPEKRAILAPGKSIVENILFENNKAEISAQSKEVLDKIILVLNANKQLKIEVGAHTDSKGDAETNLKLSDARAKTVKEYMVKNGIETGRIIAKGYGESKLLNKCQDNTPCNETEHAQNRRIEFKVLGE
ncbi:MAG: OmpA family protein [Bacteroidia bacterium]|nr:OmpA family protein [Bacteroidia bacterium]